MLPVTIERKTESSLFTLFLPVFLIGDCKPCLTVLGFSLFSFPFGSPSVAMLIVRFDPALVPIDPSSSCGGVGEGEGEGLDEVGGEGVNTVKRLFALFPFADCLSLPLPDCTVPIFPSLHPLPQFE